MRGGRDSVTNNFFVVTQKFSLPRLATSPADTVSAPSFETGLSATAAGKFRVPHESTQVQEDSVTNNPHTHGRDSTLTGSVHLCGLFGI